LRFISYNQYLFFTLIISLSGTIGSLYVSEVLNISPCALCWFQRIFMYTIPIISLIALIKRDNNAKVYLQTFSGIGFIIAVYQYIIQKTEKTSPFCSLDNDCNTIHFELLGFITLPLMGAIAFLCMFLMGFAINNKKEESVNNILVQQR